MYALKSTAPWRQWAINTLRVKDHRVSREGCCCLPGAAPYYLYAGCPACRGFNLVAVRVGADAVASGSQATLITALPAGSGIVCFIYGSSQRFRFLRSLRWGIGPLAGSAEVSFHGSLALVIISRILQTVGYQRQDQSTWSWHRGSSHLKESVLSGAVYCGLSLLLWDPQRRFPEEVQWSYLSLYRWASAVFIPVLARISRRGWTYVGWTLQALHHRRRPLAPYPVFLPACLVDARRLPAFLPYLPFISAMPQCPSLPRFFP